MVGAACDVGFRDNMTSMLCWLIRGRYPAFIVHDFLLSYLFWYSQSFTGADVNSVGL